MYETDDQIDEAQALATEPDEAQRLELERAQRLQELRSKLGQSLATKRDEAVRARVESGIELTWLECEEAYLGIDDENRAEFAGARWIKPATMSEGLRAKNSSEGVRATAYVRLTSRYVDAGAAKLCEISLPVDGRPFTLNATPVPELARAAEVPPDVSEPSEEALRAKATIDAAEQAAESASDRIYDWLVECNHNANVRRVVFDAARLGVGIIAGPEPRVSTSTSVNAQGGVAAVQFVSAVKPGTRHVDPWCFYPAPGCGENIHAGDHAFEKDALLKGELLSLKDKADLGYVPEAIDKVLAEGPGKCYLSNDGTEWKDSDARKRLAFERWRFVGWLSAEEFAVASGKAPTSNERAFVAAELINDTVIRAVRMPLDSGKLPYHAMSWRRRAGHWAGVGIAEQVRTPQRIANAATRRMLTNAAMSSGGQVVADQQIVEPADGNWSPVPDKFWWLKKDAALADADVRKAFTIFNWPNTTPQLQAVIDYAFRLAEEHSSIPLITQGQSGKTTPDTFGAAALQDNNANQLLREIGFELNDSITAPLIQQFYEWLLLDPDVPQQEKGDYQVDTSGALAIIEKSLHDIFVGQLLTASANPAFELSPARCMEAFLRAKRMNPSEFQLTEAEKEERRNAPPPEDPRIAAAKIAAESRLAVAESANELRAQQNARDLDRDTMYAEVQHARTESMRELTIHELELRRELAMLDYANKRDMSLDQIKAELAGAAMKMNLQRELAGADGKGPQVTSPPVEPEGRAPDGEAFTK